MAEKKSVDDIGFFNIFNGAVGHVVDCNEDDEDSEVFTFTNGDTVQSVEDGFIINGKHVTVNEELFGYDDPSDPEDDDSEPIFKVDVDNLVLFNEDGYRGEGCYWGLYYDEDNKRWLAIDFVSEGVVYTLE